MSEHNKPKAPAWTTLREDIRRAGGAWPPPGTREVERAVAVKPPRDHEQMTVMLIRRRKLMHAATRGPIKGRDKAMDDLRKLQRRINAYAAETSDT